MGKSVNMMRSAWRCAAWLWPWDDRAPKERMNLLWHSTRYLRRYGSRR